jgi:hypothetical protein
MEATGFFCEPSLLITCADVEIGAIIHFRPEPSATGQPARRVANGGRTVVARAEGQMSIGPTLTLRSEARSTCNGVRVLQWTLQKSFIARVGTVAQADVSDHLFKVRVPLEPGSAGAPVVGEDGSVVGLVTGGASEQDVSYAVKAEAIGRLLQKAKGALEKAKEALEPASPVSHPPPITTGPYALRQ